MPVVATMTVIAILQGRGGPRLPFFDSELLRELLDQSLAEDPDVTLKKAHAIADRLEGALEDYRSSVDTTLDLYIEESTNHYMGAAALIDQMQPLDRKRADTLREIIEIRRALLNTLDEQQWRDTFE